MKKKPWQKVLLLGWLLMPWLSWGQVDADRCRQILDEAAEQMRRPRVVIEMLSDSSFMPCLSKMPKGDKLRAYRLRAQAHLLLDPPENEAALRQWETLLKLEPEYQLDPATSPDVLIALSEQFLNRPLWSVGVGGGIHLPFVLPASQHSTANPAVGNVYQANYSPGLSWQLGTAVWFNLNAPAPLSRRLLRWELGVDLRYRVSHHHFEQQWLWLIDQASSFRTTFEERQSALGLGLTLRHNFDARKRAYQAVPRRIIPYLTVGMRWNRLQSVSLSDVQLLRIDQGLSDDQGEVLVQGIASPRIDPQRAEQAWMATLGVGAKWKVDRHYLFAELSLDHGLTNLVSPAGRFSNAQMLYQYGYLDPDWTQSRLMLSVGFLFTEYRIKRLP
jgi:hypothetical protein